MLKLAIESVRMQDYVDWEIIVSDNASNEDVRGYVNSIGDPRIRVSVQKHVVPVTDNWNAALAHATGEYVVMLGDDDALVPMALSNVAGIIEQWQWPEAVYAQALQYAYPDVVPGHREPFLQTGFNEFLADRREPFVLPTQTALRMVRGAMSFRALYGFNMQHFVVSQRLVDNLRAKGPFFQSPFPDYYAANAVLLAASRIVVSPAVFALIGISPRSFGYFHLNEREADGVEFLRNIAEPAIVERLGNRLIPGSNMNDSWLCAMETLARNFADEVGTAVNYRAYRRLQYFQMAKEKTFRVALRHMRWWEMPAYALVVLAFCLIGILPSRLRGALSNWLTYLFAGIAPRFNPQRRVVAHRDILEAAKSLAP